jgi:hypothetical protein
VPKSLRHSCRSELHLVPFVSEGGRLCLHLKHSEDLGASLESPRIAPAIDLSSAEQYRRRLTGPKRHPYRDQSLRGHVLLTEGFPRHYPPSVASSLVETAGEGFAVMSGCSHRIAPAQGNFRYLTRNFATLGVICYLRDASSRRDGHFCRPPHVAIGFGLSHHLDGMKRCSAYSL